MAAPVRAPHMTLEEFLALPEEKPYLEFVNGEVQAKPMPNANHGRIVIRLANRLSTYLERTGEGEVLTEVRHATLTRNDQRVFLPDLNVIPAADAASIPGTGIVRTHPAFAIEVLSPDDRPVRIADRVQFYLRNGTRLLWLIDPEDRTVTVFRPDAETLTHTAADTIDASPVLSSFELNLGDLFAAIRD